MTTLLSRARRHVPVLVSLAALLFFASPAGAQMFTSFDYPGGFNTNAFAINERGDIVGFSDGSNRSARAVIITDGVMRDLNGLIPAGSGWVLTEARDINDSGRIVGTGWRNGEQRGFLLTPS